jgi:hypothetical protein
VSIRLDVMIPRCVFKTHSFVPPPAPARPFGLSERRQKVVTVNARIDDPRRPFRLRNSPEISRSLDPRVRCWTYSAYFAISE